MCLSEKMQNLIKNVRFCNSIQIYAVLNTFHVFGWNIVAFHAFVVSCFGQWMMSLDVDRELNHTFLVSDTLQSYTSLWLSYSAIVNWFADQLVQIYRTILYINMVGTNMF